MDISEKGLIRSVPKGFPYVFVQWSNITGPEGSLVHIIEDESVFKRNFGQDVIAGMMDMPTSKMFRNSDVNLRPIVIIFIVLLICRSRLF